MKNTLITLVITTSLIACQPEGRVYNEHKELSPEVEWLQKDVKVFEVPITDNNLLYDISISFRYATGYQHQTANIKITEVTPSGKESSKEYELKVREANGDYIGEAGYDIWDSEHLIEPKKRFEDTGTYAYKVEHVMPNDPLNFAMEIGLIVDNAK